MTEPLIVDETPLVEAVAKAAYLAYVEHCTIDGAPPSWGLPWESLPRGTATAYRVSARAAIAEVRRIDRDPKYPPPPVFSDPDVKPAFDGTYPMATPEIPTRREKVPGRDHDLGGSD